MPSLTLRDVPEPLHRWLKQQAQAHHRSVNKEVVSLLETLSATAPAAARSAEERRAAIDEISRRCAAMPVLDDRTPDEIVGYDENGLPA